MAWGDSWGRTPSTNSVKVAEAFYAGRECKRSNCWTDGEFYWLDNVCIARRLLPGTEVAELTKELLNQPCRHPLEFRFGGEPTKHVCRHLRALGLESDFTTVRGRDMSGNLVKQVIGLMRDRKVNLQDWYSLEDLANLPVWKPSVEVERVDFARQLNMELNFG